MKSHRFLCPVCGFDGLNEAPYDKAGVPSYEICPCCGFEFGFDEEGNAARFREDWIRNGAVWFSPGSKPGGWDLQRQLAGLERGTKGKTG